jgi:importin-5
MRSFSLVLLRRLLLRTTPLGARNGSGAQTLSLYDQLPASTLSSIEQVLLHSVSNESAALVRHKAVDTVIDIANRSMERGRPWHALQVQSFAMVNHTDPGARESAFRIFAGCPVIILDLQTSGILELLQKGLQDPSVEVCLAFLSVTWGYFTYAYIHQVRHAALRSTVAYIQGCDEHQLAQSVGIMHPLLETLPSLPPAQLTQFLQSLLPLASYRPNLFGPHLRPLLNFLSALLLSQAEADPGPTPTVGRPFPGAGGGSAFSFDFPPAGSGKGKAAARPQADEEREEARKAALEFMLTLSEEKPPMVRKVDGWAAAIVRGCLEGMGELDDEDTAEWLAADVGPPNSSASACTDSRPFSLRTTRRMIAILTCMSKV